MPRLKPTLSGDNAQAVFSDTLHVCMPNARKQRFSMGHTEQINELIIGQNIRRRRLQAGVTLTALAAAAGMTKSTLSKIETGQLSSPVSTLLRIAAALGVTIADFFVAATARPPFVLTRDGQGAILTRDGSQFGYTHEALAPQLQDKLGEPFLLTIRPGDGKGRFQHGGQEFIYMLSGHLEFAVGDTVLQLGPGDSLYFDPRHVHTTQVLGSEAARFLCFFMQTPPPRSPCARVPGHRHHGGTRKPITPAPATTPRRSNRNAHSTTGKHA